MTVERSKPKAKGRYDWGLLSVVSILLILGVVMVFSASYPRGMEGYGDPYLLCLSPDRVAGHRRCSPDCHRTHPVHAVGSLEHSHHGRGAAVAAGGHHHRRRALWRNAHLLQWQHPAERAGQDRDHRLRERMVDEQGAPHSRCQGGAAALWRAHGDRGRPDRPAAGDQHGHPDRGDGGDHALCGRRRS